MTPTLNIPQTTTRGATVVWTHATPNYGGEALAGLGLMGDLLGKNGQPRAGYVMATARAGVVGPVRYVANGKTVAV